MKKEIMKLGAVLVPFALSACAMDPNKKLDRLKYVDIEETAAELFGQVMGEDTAPSPVEVRAERVALTSSLPELPDDRYPNHVLVITVMAHRNPAGMVVPTYQTRQPLYDKPIFALPGELAERRW